MKDAFLENHLRRCVTIVDWNKPKALSYRLKEKRELSLN